MENFASSLERGGGWRDCTVLARCVVPEKYASTLDISEGKFIPVARNNFFPPFILSGE